GLRAKRLKRRSRDEGVQSGTGPTYSRAVLVNWSVSSEATVGSDMDTPAGPDRRTDFLNRLNQTERRQDAEQVAADERARAEAARRAEDVGPADAVAALRAAVAEALAAAEDARRAAAELRAAAEEARRLNTEMRQGLKHLIDELRKPRAK